MQLLQPKKLMKNNLLNHNEGSAVLEKVKSAYLNIK